MVLSDDSVKFPVDSSKLSPEAQQRLTDFADKLKTDNRNVYLEIQGHTDATGPDSLNQRLGEERAEAVRLFMNQHGVPLNRMSTISYGKAGSGGRQQDPHRPGAEPPRRVDRDVLTPIGAAPGPPGRPLYLTGPPSSISGPAGSRAHPEGPTSASRPSRWRSACSRPPGTTAPARAPARCGRLPARRPPPT